MPVGRGREGSGGRGVIEVADTTVALQALARAVRRASGTKVVAITGSAGKTTTKEVTGEFLEARYTVVRNRGNLNNHIGLPLSLVALRDRPEVAVVELGMNHPGEISTLVGVAEPEVRVWTNVGEAHLEFFASVDAIADAKAEIFEGATESTLLVANANDDRIARAHASIRRAGGDLRHRVRRDRAGNPRRGSRHRRHDRARHDARAATSSCRRLSSAGATSRMCWPRRPWPSNSRCRWRPSPTGRAGCGRRRIAARSCGWRAASR